MSPPIDLSYRVEGKKLIVHGLKEGEAGPPRVELYDLIADPGELRDLSGEEDTRALGAQLAPSIQALQGVRAGPSADAATQEALRALGYLD